MNHDQWCGCPDCYGRPMLGLSVVVVVLAALLAVVMKLAW